MRFVFALCLVLACSACASSPPDFDRGPAVASDKILDRSLTMPDAAKGEVVVARWKDAAGAAIVDARIYVDGRHVANLDKGEVLRVFLAAGQHTVGVKLLGLDSTEQPVRSREIDVKSGGSYRFEVFWAGSSFDIQPKS
ncbi:hypothetical protein P3W24_04035 [Luteibacter sp. PPL201]|uniref:Lipoprotein n=1 Tax=Luteibacter sahnii TaxID=3021977 RepID=A0ABT6B7S7_9GAMM